MNRERELQELEGLARAYGRAGERERAREAWFTVVNLRQRWRMADAEALEELRQAETRLQADARAAERPRRERRTLVKRLKYVAGR